MQIRAEEKDLSWIWIAGKVRTKDHQSEQTCAVLLGKESVLLVRTAAP